MQKTNTEPQTLEDYGYCFESKHIKNWMKISLVDILLIISFK
jgi:hypothetical protein